MDVYSAPKMNHTNYMVHKAFLMHTGLAEEPMNDNEEAIT